MLRTAIAFASMIAAARALPAADEITALPGWTGALPSRQFSGYLDASPTKHLHYWMSFSEGAPETDPVVFWFNGGPGCSSLDGFLYEHGPFRVQMAADGATSLAAFEYSWAKLANMVYLEAPCGVGFSYSDVGGDDYAATDDTAAADNLAAVEAFFAKFPEFQNRSLYLTGESYAGIYVPTLAEAIVKATLAGNYTGAPLAGIAVGNGCSGHEIGTCAFGSPQSRYYQTKYLMSSGFASEPLKDELNAQCEWSEWKDGTEPSSACTSAVNKLDALTQGLDTYCVYCNCPPGTAAAELGARASKVGHHLQQREAPRGVGTTACINTAEASAYLNQPAVQEAIHVTAAKVDDWQVCGSADGWDYTSTRPNLPRDTYPLLVSNIRVLIYNGDWDACVPYTDNEGWTTGMGFNQTAPWHPWMYEDGGVSSVGGYANEFDVSALGDGAFTFVTVRGGRHEVPETAPDRAFAMFQNFLTGTSF